MNIENEARAELVRHIKRFILLQPDLNRRSVFSLLSLMEAPKCSAKRRTLRRALHWVENASDADLHAAIEEGMR